MSTVNNEGGVISDGEHLRIVCNGGPKLLLQHQQIALDQVPREATRPDS